MPPFVRCEISRLDHSEVCNRLKVARARLILAAISPTDCPVAVNYETSSKGTPSRMIVPRLDELVCADSTLVFTVLICSPTALAKRWTTLNECPFYLRVPNSLLTPLIVDGSLLSQTNIVTYLGLTFYSNLTWSFHIEFAFMRGHNICFVLKMLRSVGTPLEKL